MPNPEVKPASVDGTVWGTYGRVDHCQFRFDGEEVLFDESFLFFVYVRWYNLYT